MEKAAHINHDQIQKIVFQFLLNISKSHPNSVVPIIQKFSKSEVQCKKIISAKLIPYIYKSVD